MKVVTVMFIGWISLVCAHDVTVARDPDWSDVPLLGRQAAVLALSDELLRDIAKEEEFSVSLVSGNPESLFDYLEQGSVDAILSPQQPFPGLRDRFAFSDVYLYTGPVLVVSTGSDIDALWKLAGKIVGVRAGSDARLIAAEVPLVVIETYPSDAVALNELEQGKIDGVLMPAIPAYAFVSDLYRGVLRVVSPPLNQEGIRLIALSDNEKLVKEFNEGLEKLVKDSRYNKLQRKWRLHLDAGPSVRYRSRTATAPEQD